MLALFRSIVYAALFIGVVLVFIPEQILAATGITRPEQIGTLEELRSTPKNDWVAAYLSSMELHP